MRLIAFLAVPLEVNTILGPLGEPTTPPEVARARGPSPLWEEAVESVPHWDDSPAAVPEYLFGQRLGW